MRLGRRSTHRLAFELSPVPQAVCDSHTRLVETNHAFEALVDRPAADLEGRPLRELYHRSDPGDPDAALARLLAGELPTARAERILEGAGGRPVPTLASAAAVLDPDGRTTGAAVAYQDLSVLRGAEERRRQQEEFFLAVSQQASDLGVVLDREGHVLFCSPVLSRVLGHDVADVAWTTALEHVHGEDRERAVLSFTRALRGLPTEPATLRVRDARNAWRWVDATVTDLQDTAVGGVVVNLRDVTDRVRAERALRASERRYRAIADNADQGLWVTAADGRTVYANRRLLDILGLDEEQVLDRSVLDVLGPSRDEPDGVGYDHPDGGRRTLCITTTPLDDAGGSAEGALAMVSDVTEERRLERELRRAALHDALTGLPNRALLIDRLDHAMARETTSTAVLLVDLDRFRAVNDDRGQAVGDQLLVDVADRLSGVVRPADTLGRLGGDEFVVICEDTDETTARQVAVAVLGALREPFPTASGDVRLSASVGIAVSPATDGSLLRHAETARYAAKAAGRGQVQVFDAAVAEFARQRFELGLDLARAIAADELQLHYQPVVDLTRGDVIGAEALARWEHPRLGQVPPGRFVAVAEAEGLTVQLDRWAVRRALADAADLRREQRLAPDAYVAVNISARTLADTELDRWIGAAADSAGLSPETVVLEITESATMADPGAAIAMLQRLRQRGFRVAVDDFGTGHSSLAYLRRLPVSILKVDRTFVAELTTDPDARAITASVVDLARTIGLSVVAEGVETDEQLAVLRRLGADSGQGWLWSAAVPPTDPAGALRRHYDVDGS